MLSVATILKPQGLKGELKCELLTDVLAVFSKAKSIFVDGRELKILKANVRQGFLYITLEGIMIFNHRTVYFVKNRNKIELTSVKSEFCRFF